MPRVASVTNVIEVSDFDTVWNFLESKFGYSKDWRIACGEYLSERFRVDPLAHPVLDFLTFGCQHVNPLLNAALCRNVYYATFSRMVFWLLRDRLEHVGWIRFSEDETF